MLNNSNDTNNQNDSIVLCKQAVQRGLGQSLAFHSTRFDIHRPYRLFTAHPDIPGGLGVVLPGTNIRIESPMISAIAVDDSASPMATQEPVLRCAKTEDVGSVYRVVITCGMEGYVLLTHGAYNLHTWSPVRLDQIRLGSVGSVNNGGGSDNAGRAPIGDAITVRITVVSLREPQVGATVPRVFRYYCIIFIVFRPTPTKTRMSKLIFAHSTGTHDELCRISLRVVTVDRCIICAFPMQTMHRCQKGTVGGILMDQSDMPFTINGMVPDVLFALALFDWFQKQCQQTIHTAFRRE